ncbi:MAG: hypothetical protein MHMPM18_003127 [Marteilia pararefringens]
MDLITTAFDYNFRRSQEDPHTDAVDKFNSKYVVIYLAISTVLISADIFFGKPIECWVPEDFGKSDYVSYIIEFCWLNHTRYVDPSSATYDLENSRNITYYQWVGFILIFLIGIYITPTFVWKALYHNLDVSMSHLCDLAAKYNISNNEKLRQDCVNQITSSLVKYLSYQKYNRFAWTFMAIKVLALMCSIFAILILCVIFGREYAFFSIRFLYLLANEQRIDSAVFPLETMCDIKLYVQNLNSSNNYTLPCMLVHNLFTIFIFTFLNALQWLVVCANCFNIIVWAERLTIRGRKRFISSYLYNTPVMSNRVNEKLYYRFIDTLRPDGAVILHLLSTNSSDYAVAAIVREMCLVSQRTHIEPKMEADTDVEDIMGAEQGAKVD